MEPPWTGFLLLINFQTSKRVVWSQICGSNHRHMLISAAQVLLPRKLCLMFSVVVESEEECESGFYCLFQFIRLVLVHGSAGSRLTLFFNDLAGVHFLARIRIGLEVLLVTLKIHPAALVVIKLQVKLLFSRFCNNLGGGFLLQKQLRSMEEKQNTCCVSDQ